MIRNQKQRVVQTAATLLVASAICSGNVSASIGNPIVEAFSAACLPERLSYSKSVQNALDQGWQSVPDTSNPELNQVMTRARAAAKDSENPDWTTQLSVHSKEQSGKQLFLVYSRLVAPDVLTLIGCYVYDFDATDPISPEGVGKMLNHTLAYSTQTKGGDYYIPSDQLISYVWGPPPDYPRQFDTHLSFIPENSPLVSKTGFTGLVLKSSASEPKSSK